MRSTFKAVSPVIATLLIILIVVTSSVIVYLWVSGYAGSLTSASTEQTLREAIKIEAIKTIETDEGTLIILWVRNIGDATVKINSAYYGTTQGYKQANLAYTSSSPPIWGGDIWTFNRETQTIEKTQDGLIFYEDFRDGYDPALWSIEINTLESGERGEKKIDSSYGLILTISRTLSDEIEKYGIRTTNRLSIPDGKYVIEITMGKLSGTSMYYTGEIYLSPGGISGDSNPYSALWNYLLEELRTPYFTSKAAIVRRYNGGQQDREWLSTVNNVVQARWILRFKGTYNGVEMYCNETPAGIITDPISRGVYEYPYIYAIIGIWSGQYGSVSIYFKWVKVYKDLAFIVNNLNEGWRVLLINGSNILGDKTVPAGEDSISFDRLDDNIIYPLDVHIVVIPTADDASEIGYVIRPGEVKSVALFITESLPESFSVKVVTENGVEAVFNVKR